MELKMIFLPRVFRNAYEVLRSPDRQPKCYDMTDQERSAAIVRLNRNVWNDPGLSSYDQYKTTRDIA